MTFSDFIQVDNIEYKPVISILNESASNIDADGKSGEFPVPLFEERHRYASLETSAQAVLRCIASVGLSGRARLNLT